MTIRAAIATIVACTLFLAGIGGGIGWALGTYAPGYYRSVFPSGNQPWFDPVSVGVGQGLTQGTTGGVILGGIVVALFVWRDSRFRGAVRSATILNPDTSRAPILEVQQQPRAITSRPPTPSPPS